MTPKKKRQENVKPSPMEESKNIPTDVLGSYTGVPRDGGQPVQDADDL